MSRISAHYNELTESGRLEIDEFAPEVELPVDFNAWMEEVEKDKDYLAKEEKRLDDELGKDRLI